MTVDGKIPADIMRLAAEQTLELSTVDNAHVYSILRHAVDKLALVGSITVDPKIQAAELIQRVGEEITRMIQGQKDLERRFESLVTAQHTLRNLPNKSKLRENQVQLQQVAESLRQSTKTLCRSLKDNPNVAENMAKVASERCSLAVLLSRVLGELEVFRKVTPVVEVVLAVEASKVAQEQTLDHERTTTSAVKQLRNDLKDEKSDAEEKIREKKRLVAGLKEQLRELSMSSAVETRFMAKDTNADNESQRRLENVSIADLRKELTQVQQQIDIEVSVHAATIDFLRRASTKLQEESISWGGRREEEMAALERELEVLKQNHARDERRLREAEERWRAEDLARREREVRLLEEREKEEMAALLHAKRVQSAITIQAAWRGYAVRTAGKRGKGKGKGKGKGSPKKGKK